MDATFCKKKYNNDINFFIGLITLRTFICVTKNSGKKPNDLNVIKV